jgi:hypothetical protein
MKKIILGILCVFMLMACVSASDLESEDFENFTIDVPSDASFQEAIPAGTEWGVDKAGNIVPMSVNPYWTDESNNIAIEYGDMDYKKLMDQRFEDAILSDEKGDIHTYDISKCEYANDYEYAVCVEDGAQATVVIYGSDLDTLNEMAKSVEFN